MKTPKPNTSLKRSRPKKARKHLPSLSQLTRDMLAMQMLADSRIPARVSEAVMQSFNAAANPNAETPETVIETLDPMEKALVKNAISDYQQVFGNVGMKGRMGLMMMTDEQWNALADDD
jgi:hypothetical protein